MNASHASKRPLVATAHDRWSVQITDDGSPTLIDPATGVSFHSGSGAAAESRHVYLSNSGVAERLGRGMETAVLEIGLGTGMTMLMTVEAAIEADAPLRYTAIERELLPAWLLGQMALEQIVGQPALVERFLEWRRELPIGRPGELHCWQAGPRQSVTVFVGDALAWIDPRLDDSLRSDLVPFDAIYFDPFAPDENPEVWTPVFLSALGSWLHAQGKLVTYAVRRSVQSAMLSAGFQIERVAGPVGGKREVMIATHGQRE